MKQALLLLLVMLCMAGCGAPSSDTSTEPVSTVTTESVSTTPVSTTAASKVAAKLNTHWLTNDKEADPITWSKPEKPFEGIKKFGVYTFKEATFREKMNSEMFGTMRSPTESFLTVGKMKDCGAFARLKQLHANDSDWSHPMMVDKNELKDWIGPGLGVGPQRAAYVNSWDVVIPIDLVWITDSESELGRQPVFHCKFLIGGDETEGRWCWIFAQDLKERTKKL